MSTEHGGRPAESRPSPRPTVRGLVLGALGAAATAAALALHRADLLLLGLVLLLAVLGAHLLLLLDRGPRLLVHRSVRPDAVNAGDAAVVTVTVRDAAGRAVALLPWRDRLPAGIAAGAREAGATPGDPSTARIRYPVTAGRRGALRLGPLVLDRTDPLGLALVRTAVGPTATLVVNPRVTRLDPSPLDESVAGGAELVTVRRTTPSLDEVSARDYERGDPMRRVNWRTSAKRGRLMVRQEEQRAEPRTLLLLDTVGERADRPGDAFELGVELAASIGVHAVEQELSLGVVETGTARLSGGGAASGTGYLPPDGGRLLVAQLALVEPAAAAAAPIDEFAEQLRRAGSGTPAIAILVDGPLAWWRELAGLRGLAGPAVAFLLTPTAAAARPELEAAGWTCVPVAPGTDPATAWNAATGSPAQRTGTGTGRA